MNDKYEFEEARNDDRAAKMGIGTLLCAAVGLGIKYALNTSNNNKKESIKQQIDRKMDQCRILESKWLKSAAEKEEIKRLHNEIDELKSQLDE